MSFKNNPSAAHGADNQIDEVGEANLHAVSGGQGAAPVQRLDTMVVTAKRIPARPVVQKLDTMGVTAKRLPTDLSGVQVVSAYPTVKKGSQSVAFRSVSQSAGCNVTPPSRMRSYIEPRQLCSRAFRKPGISFDNLSASMAPSGWSYLHRTFSWS